MAEIVIAKYLDVREIHILKMNDLQKEKSFAVSTQVTSTALLREDVPQVLSGCGR